MKYAFFFRLILVALPTFVTSCERDEMPLPQEMLRVESQEMELADATAPRHGSFLIWLDGTGSEPAGLPKRSRW